MHICTHTWGGLITNNRTCLVLKVSPHLEDFDGLSVQALLKYIQIVQLQHAWSTKVDPCEVGEVQLREYDLRFLHVSNHGSSVNACRSLVSFEDRQSEVWNISAQWQFAEFQKQA